MRPITASARPRLAALSLCIAAALACGLAGPRPAQAQSITNSSLYYKLGGHSPYGGALNKSTLGLHLGMSLRLNYSCGKFDIGLSWTNLMNQLDQLGHQLEASVQAAIIALPMYAIQRASPGLYQLFQTYSANADLLTAAALKTCEQMEREIRLGGNPYQDFIDAAKNLQWKYEIDGSKHPNPYAKSGGDIVQAKTAIDSQEQGQRNGIPWVFSSSTGAPANAGGVNQPTIKPIHDLTVAGYQITCNIQTPSNALGSQTNLCPTASLLAQTFETPEKMADWTIAVLGDHEIATCSDRDCPQPTAGTTATGLGPRLQSEIDFVGPILVDVLNNPGNTSNLEKISAPGFAISGRLMETVRRLPADERPLVIGRFIQEMAMHRTVNKALMARNVLLAGLSIPQATKDTTQLQKNLQSQIDRLTHYIDDLLYEWRIRKEVTGNTAMTVMQESVYKDSLGALERQGQPNESAPLINGRVQ